MSNENDTLTVNIVIGLFPSADITEHSLVTLEVFEKDTIELFVKANYAEKYEWYFNEQHLETHPKGEQSVLVLENLRTDQSGQYTCRVYDQCNSNNVNIDLTVNEKQDTTPPASIFPEQLEQDIVIYPNPAINGQLTIDNLQLTANRNPLSIEIYDMNGKRVYSAQPNSASSIVNSTFTINIAHLPNGIYILKLQNKTFKFTKQ